MPASNRALVTAGASCVFAQSGSGGVATNLPIDGNDATGVTLNTVNTWNVLVDLGAVWAIDSFRILSSGSFDGWLLYSLVGGDESNFIRIDTFSAGDTGLVNLGQIINMRFVECRFFVNVSGAQCFTIEAWNSASEAPATPGDVGTSLADWFDPIVATKPASDPQFYPDTLANVDDQLTDWAFGLGAAAHGYYELMRGLLQTVKDNTDALPDVIQTIVDAAVDHLDSEIATILSTIDDVLSQLGAQSTDLSGTAGGAIGALSARTGFPSTGWTMSAEADFEDAIAFVEPADAYVINVTSYQDTQPASESPAGLWLYRLGWWCVLNGSLASRREFVEFQQQLLSDGGRRMPGCAIQLRPGTLATVQAWLLA